MMISGVLAAVLGSGASMTIALGVYDRIRNRRFDKRKQETTIKLDEATYNEIAARAEQVDANKIMAVGAFWQGQFSELSKRFEAEQRTNRERWDRMTRKAHEHKLWDEKLLRKLADCNINDMESPPSLDPDEE